MKQRLRARSRKKGNEANREKKIYILKNNNNKTNKQTKQNNNEKKKRKKERKGTMNDSNPHLRLNVTSPYH